MTSRELTARQKKNSHDKVERERGMIKSKQKVDSCFMTGFGVWFLNGKEEEKKIAKREERENEKRRGVKKKNGLYSGFTFQITAAAAATLKTNTGPTAAWKFKLGPALVVNGVPAP